MAKPKIKKIDDNLSDVAVNVTDFGDFTTGTDVTNTMKLGAAHCNISGEKLLIPAGDYIISDTVTFNRMSPLVCSGVVKFTYAITDTSKSMFQFNMTSEIDVEHMYNFGIWLDGGNGGLILKNTGQAGIAIKIGTDTNTGFNNRLQKFKNVGICGFDLGVQFTKYNNYILSFENCVWAYNNYHVCFGTKDTIDTVTNSGENLSFYNCVFSQAYKSAFYWNTNGFDCNFYSPSFDFNECIFKQLDGISGGKIVNVYGGHIEGTTYFTGDNASSYAYGIVYGTTATSSLMTEFRSQFNFDGTIMMLNNTKKVFLGNSEVNLTNIKIKLMGTIMNTKLASLLSLRDSTALKMTYKGISFPNARYGMKMPALQQNIIPFSEFEDLTVQSGLSTVTQINKAYKIDFKRNTDDAVNVIDGGAFGGKYIEVEFHDYGVTNTYLTFNILTNRYIKVTPGKELVLFPVMKLDTLPSKYVMAAEFNFYSGTDLISTQSSVYFRYATSIPASASSIGIEAGDVNQWIVPFSQIDKVIVPQGADCCTVKLNNEIQGLTTDVSKWYFGGMKLFEL